MASESAVVGGLESGFLILVYAFVLFRGAKIVNEARQVLLEIFTPGYVSAVFLTVVSSLPTAIVILMSGIRGSQSTAETQILIGSGSLVGSTVLLLTLLWGSCIFAGRSEGQDVKTDANETRRAAWIMIASAIPFLVAQLPLLFNGTTTVRIVTLVAFLVSMALLVSYVLFQIWFPAIQMRRLAFVHHSELISLDTHGLERLKDANGKPNVEALLKLFKVLDRNSDGVLSVSELRALLIGVQFEETDLGITEGLKKHIQEYSTKSGKDEAGMNVDKFVDTMSKWINEYSSAQFKVAGYSASFVTKMKSKIRFKHMHRVPLPDRENSPLMDNVGSGSGSSRRRRSLSNDIPSTSNDDEIADTFLDPKMHLYFSILKLITGILLVAAASYPLVDVIDDFSSDSGIPMFFVSFIILPIACYSWVGSAVLIARKKKARMVSLTFSEIYEAVTVNNIFCTMLFLGVVYVRDLTWEFSSEALTTLVVTVAVGVLAGFRTVFPVWIGVVAFALYPFSLALVYVLRYVAVLS